MLKILDLIIVPIVIVAVAVLLLDMPVLPAIVGTFIGIWIALYLRRRKEEKRGEEHG